MSKFVYYLVLIAIIALSCESPSGKQQDMAVVEETPVGHKSPYNVDSVMAIIGLVPVDSVNPEILVDLRYATTNNFMCTRLYDTLQRAYLQKEVAIRLGLCQQFLDSIKPGYHLKVFDAVRPLNVQRKMWHALDTVPVLVRGRYVSNPSFGSVHNFGAAVDLTICNEKGEELDMGAGYDDFRDIAFPSKENKFLASGELKMVQWNNRKLLRRVMSSQKFYNIPSEWWHFNGFSRPISYEKYPQLLTESGKAEFKISSHSKEESLDTLEAIRDTTGKEVKRIR